MCKCPSELPEKTYSESVLKFALIGKPSTFFRAIKNRKYCNRLGNLYSINLQIKKHVMTENVRKFIITSVCL